MYKLQLTVLQQEILRVLFMKIGKPLNQRRIAKLLNVSPPAIMKALPKLEKGNLISIQQDKESKRWSIELNRDNPKSLELKRVDNLRLIYESGFINFLEKEFAGGTIILFGSYSRGEDTINSDIDIAIIERKDKLVHIEKFEKVLGREINLNFYDSWKKIQEHLKNNILNGIVLVGSIEL
jgi:predicted nucleotidyltransferase